MPLDPPAGASGQSVQEGLAGVSQLASALKAGLEVLSQNQVLTLHKYVRMVLPLDGYVFWVRADILSPSAVYNTSPYARFAYNQPPVVVTAAPIETAPGSLHITTTNQQDADESFSVNRMVFTSERPINDLNDISPGTMFLAKHGPYKFAFSQRRSWYKQAGLYHYVGDAVYPVMESQIIDDPAQLDLSNIIVSNSLPIWLQLNAIMPVFPSFLVPDNTAPPYASVHIGDDATRALTSVPVIDRMSNHWQLVSDKVRVTLYGLRNFNALDYVDYVFDYMRNYGVMGLMNSPVIRDAKRTQTELSVIAQKKVIEFEVSYHQVRVREVAQQLIKQSFLEDLLVQTATGQIIITA